MSSLKIDCDPYSEILTDRGPMTFGLVLSADVVSWSAPDAQDLLVARCWQGVYLYPSMDLENFGDPIKLCDQLGHTILIVEPADWNNDGIDEAVGSDRNGYMLCLKRTGDYPNLRLEPVQDPLLSQENLTFNIPFDNHHHRLTSQAGYIKPEYFNYTYPTAYPSPKGHGTGLIVGDWGGFLWWMPPIGIRDGLPQYDGERYVKTDGREFAKPRFRILDENGSPFLLGEGTECGVRYPGGAARPVLYRNGLTGSADLLVLCGTIRNELNYLQRQGTSPEGVPVFRNLGSVLPDGRPDANYDPFAYHSIVATAGRDGWDYLLISTGGRIGVYRNKRFRDGKPEFVFSHWIGGRDVPTQGFNYTEILTDPSGRRFILENDNTWSFREILKKKGEIRLSSDIHDLRDQYGVFQVEGETDHIHMTNWGLHRAALWDYDGSGRQHLIISTDKGLLYLLCEEEPVGTDGRFEFRSFGPLKDSSGEVIRVYNRVVAAPIDLTGDGALDLVLGGASYQLGMEKDPNPGAGIYYTINRGLDSDGLPVLDPVRPIEMLGLNLTFNTNQHVQLQALDLFGDGGRVLAVATQDNWFQPTYVFRPAQDRIALEYTGITLPSLSIDERFLDLDGDGRLEHLRSGGESLISSYSKCELHGKG